MGKNQSLQEMADHNGMITRGCAKDAPEQNTYNLNGCAKHEPEQKADDGNVAVSDGSAKDEPEKKKTRTNKLEKDDKYNTKLFGAEFFKWAKETKKNKQSVKGAGKDTEKADDSGKVDHTLGGAHDQHVGYTIYSDYVKKTYGAAKKELGVKASHKEVMLKVAELWRTSDERAVNLHSKRDAQSMKVKTSGMSEGRPAKKKRTVP